jgi:uncharacterized protein
VITLDTSGVVALVNARDPNHREARAAIEGAGPLVAPALVLGETAYMIALRTGHETVVRFLEAFEEGSVLLDCGDMDLPRIRDLMMRFSDLRLGFADAAVVACTERNGGSVLTFDRRDFEVIARDVPITLMP